MAFRFNDRTYYVDSDHDYTPYESAKDGDSAWVFSFGVYSPPGVIVYGGSLDDALENAVAGGHAGGAMGEPDYQGAAEDAGFTLKKGTLYDDDGDEIDWDSTEGNEVREDAEAGLTYTESGWLVNWEWSVTEIEPDDLLYGDGVAAWVVDNADTIDDGDFDIRQVLASAGASSARMNKAVAAVRRAN